MGMNANDKVATSIISDIILLNYNGEELPSNEERLISYDAFTRKIDSLDMSLTQAIEHTISDLENRDELDVEHITLNVEKYFKHLEVDNG